VFLAREYFHATRCTRTVVRATEASSVAMLPVGTIGMRSIMHRGKGEESNGGDRRGGGTMKGTRAIFLRTREKRSRAARVACKSIACALRARCIVARAPSPPAYVAPPLPGRPRRKYCADIRATTWKDPLERRVPRGRRREEICVITTRTRLHYQAASRGSFVSKKKFREEEEEARRSHPRATGYAKRDAKSAARKLRRSSSPFLFPRSRYDLSKSERKRDRESSPLVNFGTINQQ